MLISFLSTIILSLHDLSFLLCVQALLPLAPQTAEEWADQGFAERTKAREAYDAQLSNWAPDVEVNFRASNFAFVALLSFLCCWVTMT